MATGGAADDPHVCGVCLESYRGRNPKLLPCYHTFCLSCLRDLKTRATLVSTRGMSHRAACVLCVIS